MDKEREKKTEPEAVVPHDGVITLRPVTPGDTDLILRWRNADFMRRHFIFRETLTREMHETWLRTKVKSGEVVQFILYTGTPEEEGRPFGSVYLRDVDYDLKTAEFGIFIGEADALGKGYGTRATRMMLDYAFDSLGLTRVFLRAFVANRAALDSYRRAGFRILRTLKDVESTDGETADMYWMEATHA